jgi:hypothetical protein
MSLGKNTFDEITWMHENEEKTKSWSQQTNIRKKGKSKEQWNHQYKKKTLKLYESVNTSW